jgi:hypothetical protein
MGEMKRAIARKREAWVGKMQDQTRMKSTLVIAAAIIAAVRLARDGYKLPISSTDRRGIGECQPGANDFGSSGEIAGGRLGSSPDRKGGHRTRAVGEMPFPNSARIEGNQERMDCRNEVPA